MKKLLNAAKILLIVILVLGSVGVIYYKSKPLQDKVFYSSGLVPKEIFDLNAKIDAVGPTDTTSQRAIILNDIDNFITSAVKAPIFSPKAYMLVKIRLDQALAEIPKTTVPVGEVKLWYIYNMGVIAKSADTTVAFDLASHYVYSSMKDFAKNIDVLVITHFHNDHFDVDVVKEALANGSTVVIPDDSVVVEGKMLVRRPGGKDILEVINEFYGIKSDKLIALKPDQIITVKGVEITGYPANHIFSPEPGDEGGINAAPVDWFYVKLADIGLLHTGDGDGFDRAPNFTTKKIDALITHSSDAKANDFYVKVVPNVKTILPLHVMELLHGSEITNYMMYRNISESYTESTKNVKFIPMVWGENVTLK